MSVSILRIAAPLALGGALVLGTTAADAQGQWRRFGGPGIRAHIGGGGAFRPRFNPGIRAGFNRGPNFAFNRGPGFGNRWRGPAFAAASFNGRRWAGGNWNRNHWRWRHGRWWGPALAAGIGFGLGASYYGWGYPYDYGYGYPASYYGYAYDDAPYYGDTYVETSFGADDSSIAYCRQRYRSYDIRTQTFLGNDGQRHPCP